VAIRLSPYGAFNGMELYSEIDERYLALVRELGEAGVAYVHLVDHSSMGTPPVSGELVAAIRATLGSSSASSRSIESTSIDAWSRRASSARVVGSAAPRARGSRCDEALVLFRRALANRGNGVTSRSRGWISHPKDDRGCPRSCCPLGLLAAGLWWLTAAALLVACGDGSDGLRGPGEFCETTAECEAGLVCSFGVCNAASGDSDADVDADGDADRDGDADEVGDGDVVADGDVEPEESGAQLWHEIDLASYGGTYVSPGDLDNDGRVDLLLHRMGPLTTPGLVVAMDFDGEVLWEVGDTSIESHQYPEGSGQPPVRGLAFVYDIDEDAESEAIFELWEEGAPMLYVVDGATGATEHVAPSPFDLSVRLPEGYHASRGHPVGRVAFLDGAEGPPSLVLKYGASNRIPGHVVALDADLGPRWHAELDVNATGHIPTVGDVDDDGRDEVLAGEALLDDDGTVIWQQPFGRHADMTEIADVHPDEGVEVLMSICTIGPAYCLDPDGTVLWQLSADVVTHGQGIWAGDFLTDEPGVEVVVLRSGHTGEFMTVRGADGAALARFTHSRAPVDSYPDLPLAVRWRHSGDLLWVPQDRVLVDGHGLVVADLAPSDEHVVEVLHPGATVTTLAVQAMAMDLCGDERQELVLYHPYAGSSVLFFSQPGHDCAEKPYVHTPAAYNLRTYF
jgi:hypothetical protein